MKIFWHNNGQPNAEGNYEVEVQNDEGGRVSTFKGPDLQTITSKALTASAQASDTIAQLRKTRQPDHAPAAPVIGAPRELSADERFQLASDLQDPAKAPEAMDKLIEARTGAKPQAIGQTLSSVQREAQARQLKIEVDRFIANNPDYYPANENRVRMEQAMQLAGHDWTSNNLQIVYDELQSQGLLTERPDDEAEDLHEQHEQPGTRQAAQPAQESNLPRQTRPRQVSTSSGMRASQTSATPPPSQPVARYTRKQLEEMPREEYHEKMRDPKFVAMVNQMPRR